MDTNVRIKDVGEEDDGLLVLPSRRGINPEDPGFNPDEFLDTVCEQAMSIQREKLREILARNAEVEYLQRHGLAGRTDVESFRKCIPLVSYSDVEEDIMKLVNGDEDQINKPVFTIDPIIFFHRSSGTTAGKVKYFPETLKGFDGLEFPARILKSLAYKNFPGFKGGKHLALVSIGEQYGTPSGIMVGSLTTNYLKSHFRNRVAVLKDGISSPDAVILCKDTSQGLYCHLLCALAESASIVKVRSLFASTMVGAIRALQKQWPEIVEDIRTGTLNEKITDAEVRSEVQKVLKPNPEQASRVEMECSKEDWASIIPRLFPNAHFVECVTSGTMYQYAPALEHFSGHLPILSTFYAASECSFLGLNPNPNCAPKDVTYMLWPEAAYYEFVPVEPDGQQSPQTETRKVLEACELQVGKEYELLLTTVSGLYRYHLGDILRVQRLRKNYPIFEFVRRKNVVLSVDTDKTDEAELQVVIDKASAMLGGTSMELVDYTTTVDLSSMPGYYVIYWEMTNNRSLDESVLQKCTNTIDESFNPTYQRARARKIIGPCELRVLEEGTMEELKALGRNPAQYKMPRFVNASHLLKLLNERTLVSFQST